MVESFDRIELVDTAGTSRMTLTVEQGNEIDPVAAARIATAAGLILRDPSGRERGGVAWVGGDDGRPVIGLDHQHGEDFGAAVLPDGIARVYVVQDRELDGGQRAVVMEASGSGPQVALRDREGRPRLRLGLDDSGGGVIEFLDAEGRVVRRLDAGDDHGTAALTS